MATIDILVGDVRAGLRTLGAGSVRCVVTSPPYFGLRDYGVDGQIGLEPTPAAYLSAMTDVFAEVKRVLCDDGTCWINLRDSYAGGSIGRKDGGREIDSKPVGTPSVVFLCIAARRGPRSPCGA